MRRLFPAVLGVVAIALNAPAAHAGGDSTHLGGCSLVAVTDGGAQATAEIDVEAVLHSPSSPGTPVSATITCVVTVNGVPQPGAVVASGTVVVAGAGVVTYTRDRYYDDVRLCQRIDYTGPGDATPTVDECFEANELVVPPPIVWELLPWHMLCIIASAASPGAGPVYTDPEGDVYIAGQPFYDCPPYDIEWGS